MSQEDCEVAALPKTAIVRQALRITAHLGEAQLSLEEKPLFFQTHNGPGAHLGGEVHRP